MDATTMGSRMTIFVKVVFRFILPGVTTADGDGDGDGDDGGGIIVGRMCTVTFDDDQNWQWRRAGGKKRGGL